MIMDDHEEEEIAVDVLKKVEDKASSDELEHILYRFRGLVDNDLARVGDGPVVSSYLVLRESPDYHTSALSLTHYIVKDAHACMEDILEEIYKCIQKRCVCESNRQIPKLMLRSTLSTIASQLEREQAEQLIALVAEMHLKVHPDRFGDSYRLLKLFEMMESRHMLDDRLSALRDALQLIKRFDLVEKFIDVYNPNKLISVSLTKGRQFSNDTLSPALVSTLLGAVSEGELVNASEDKNLKTLVLKHSTQIQQCLNFTTLLPTLTNPDISFLSHDELQFVMKGEADAQRANNLLLMLAQKPIAATRKFLVCLWLAREHLGHEDLFCMLWPNISKTEVSLITDMCKRLAYASLTPIETPPAFTELQGDLTRHSFRKVEGVLWDNFSRGDYETLSKITSRLGGSPSQEWSIVGKWFNAMNCVFVHDCKDHSYCIENVLEPALQQCRHPSVLNRNILEGRVRLRLAQVYLMCGNKLKAVENSTKARQLLSLTCGYDLAKLLLREAKVMSATQPRRRTEIEAMYLAALHNFDEDHVCCRPTAHLSLAAFYLNITFGSKPCPESAVPIPSSEDIRKAKSQLEALDKLGLFLPSMRLCERNLLMAELLRLEEKFQEALTLFHKTAEDSRKTGLANLVAIAEHRCKMIRETEEKSAFLDQLLQDIDQVL